jgi:xanthine dehydrogenase accessory factor
MNAEYLETIRRLEDRGEPFVLATVVRAEKPTSAKPGAKAVISADGTLTGWIGGSCAEPTVRREARKVLADGQPRLVRLCPPERLGKLSQEGVTEVTQTCISGGTLEIFIEPRLVAPHLIVIGHLAIAESLVTLGKDLGFSITVAGLEVSTGRFSRADRVLDSLDLSQLEIKSNTFIIVASHGNYDEDGLSAALRSGAGYVALVSSKTRAQALIEYLRETGLPEERLAQLKVPAGLDIGAITPEEIALSILAEIVQVIRLGEMPGFQPERSEAQIATPAEARDPVCGMMVEIKTARYVSHFKGETYYFCAKSCQRSFEAEPQKYLAVEESHAH